jgi:hypothetical protein
VSGVDAASTREAGADATTDEGGGQPPIDASQGGPDAPIVDARPASDGPAPDVDAADAAPESDADATVESGVESGAETGAETGVDAAADVASDAPAADGATDASADAADSAGACNTLDNSIAPVVTEVDMPGPGGMGLAMGGTPVGGTYVLTSYTVYGGPGTGGTLQATIAVSTGAQWDGGQVSTVDSIENANGAGDVTYTHDWTSLFNSSLRSKHTCGPSGSILDTTGTMSIGYTATSTQITLYADSGMVSRVYVFALQ